MQITSNSPNQKYNDRKVCRFRRQRKPDGDYIFDQIYCLLSTEGRPHSSPTRNRLREKMHLLAPARLIGGFSNVFGYCMTDFKLMVAQQSGKGPNLKVVKWW